MTMFATLSRFDAITAAGILARAAVSIEDECNPATRDGLVDDEFQVREQLLAELRHSLGVPSDDFSDETVTRLADALDEESDRLVGPLDDDSALRRLSERGALPSDLYEVQVIPQIQEFHGRKFGREKELIELTVSDPDREQHYGPSEIAGEAALISLFLKFFPDKHPFRSFWMLVAGQRHGMILQVHQAWRVYGDEVRMDDSESLVDLLRRFSDRFGVNVKVGDQTGKLVMKADIASDGPVEHSFQIDMSETPGSAKRKRRQITFSSFHQVRPKGGGRFAALVIAIDLDEYRESLDRHGA